jgi:hypothetical protein
LSPISPFGWKEDEAPWLSPEELEKDRKQIAEYAESYANAVGAAAVAASDPVGSAVTAEGKAITAAATKANTAQASAEGAAIADTKVERERAESAEALKSAKAANLADLADAGSSRASIHVPVLTPVLAIATANVTLSGLQAIDGVTPGSGTEELKTVLLTGQTEAKNNGPWNQAAGAWTRPTEFAEALAVKARTAVVLAGTQHEGSEWVLSTTAAVTVGTTAQVWKERQPASVVSSSAATTIYAANLGLAASKTAAENAVVIEALEALLTAAGNVTVVFPAGQIATAAGLTIKSANVTLRCWGTVFAPTAAVKGNFIRSTAANTRIIGATLTATGSGVTTGILGTIAATGMKVTGCVVTGVTSTEAVTPQGAGIAVSGDNSEVRGNEVSSNGGTFYYQQMGGIIALGVSGTSGRRIVVAGNRCFSNQVHGVYASGTDSIELEGNYCYLNGILATENGNYGRGITVGSAACLGPKVIGNTLYENQENGLIVEGGVAGGGSDSSLVKDAIIMGNHAYRNNRGNNPGGHGLECNTVGATITGNVCYENHNGISCSGIMFSIIGNRCYNNRSTTSNQGNGIQVNFEQTKVVVPEVVITVPGAVIEVTITEGSPTATVVSGGFPSVVAGMAVYGTGIALGTTVASVEGNTLTLSQEANVGATETLSFASCVVASGGFPLVQVDENVAGTGIAASTVVAGVSGNTVLLSAVPTAAGTVTLTFTSVVFDHTIVGNICHNNDNNGINSIGNATYNGPTIAHNHCFYNGVQNRQGEREDIRVDAFASKGVYEGNVTKNVRYSISIADTTPTRRANTSTSDSGQYKTLTQAATITASGEAWEVAQLEVTEEKAITIEGPEVNWPGRRVTYHVYDHLAAGVMKPITWSATAKKGFVLTEPWVNPGKNQHATITFVYTNEQWYEVGRSLSRLVPLEQGRSEAMVAGEITITAPAVTTSNAIQITTEGGTAIGASVVERTAGTGFKVKATATSTDRINWAVYPE